MGALRHVRVSITGRVQGVGYRAWTEGEARTRGLDGWVRNRRDGAVEALFSGDTAVVEAMLAACRDGPSAALVSAIDVVEVEAPAEPGFRV